MSFYHPVIDLCSNESLARLSYVHLLHGADGRIYVGFCFRNNKIKEEGTAFEFALFVFGFRWYLRKRSRLKCQRIGNDTKSWISEFAQYNYIPEEWEENKHLGGTSSS